MDIRIHTGDTASSTARALTCISTPHRVKQLICLCKLFSLQLVFFVLFFHSFVVAGVVHTGSILQQQKLYT